jgi:hypothetical protein
MMVPSVIVPQSEKIHFLSPTRFFPDPYIRYIQRNMPTPPPLP